MRLIVSLFVLLHLACGAQAAQSAKKAAPAKKSVKSQWSKSGKTVAAKGKKKYKKQNIVRVKLFDTKEFSKLTFSKKKAFLKAVSDYLAATGKDRKVASYDSLMDLLIPSAEAAVYLRNAGFMVSGESRSGTAENFDTRQFFNVDGVGAFAHACGTDKPYPGFVPCSPSLGLDSSDKAFCVPNTPSQLKKCLDASSAGDGLDNLAKYITANPENMALRAMLGNNMSQIQAECSGAGASSNYCTKLNASISSLKTNHSVDLATYLDDATLVAPPANPEIPQNESCFAATKEALETIHGGKLDPRWTAATSLAKRNCGLGESWDEALRHYGDCYQNDRVRRPMEMPTTLKAIMGTTSDLTKIEESGQLKREFASYFGMTVKQFKDSFCQPGAGAVAMAIDGLSADGSRLDLNGVAATPQGYMATALDNMRKSGVNNVDRKNLVLAFNKVIEDMRKPEIVSSLPSGSSAESVKQFAASAVRMLNATGADAATVTSRRAELEATNATGMEAALRLAASYTTYTTAMTRLGTEANNAMEAARRGGDGTLSSSEMTAANNSYNAMKSCAGEAILPPATGGTSGMETTPAQSRYNAQCQVDPHSAIRLDGLASERSTKPIIISNGSQCYFFEGMVPGDANSALMHDSFTAAKFGPKTLEQLQAEGFSILQFRCDGGGAAPAPAPDTGTEAIINI